MTCEHLHFETGGASVSAIMMVDRARPYTIRVCEELMQMEWSDRWGPYAVTKTGRVRELGPYHKFWRAASLWHVQGRRVEDGEAIWHEPRNIIVLKQVGRHIVDAIDGEEGYDW